MPAVQGHQEEHTEEHHGTDRPGKQTKLTKATDGLHVRCDSGQKCAAAALDMVSQAELVHMGKCPSSQAVDRRFGIHNHAASSYNRDNCRRDNDDHGDQSKGHDLAHIDSGRPICCWRYGLVDRALDDHGNNESTSGDCQTHHDCRNQTGAQLGAFFDAASEKLPCAQCSRGLLLR